ncbi:30S ribosomal protein S3 [Patescibacteria group bacterium]|nr:30S ribosomal protein S3 [Patescibacteria group bacterium]
MTHKVHPKGFRLARADSWLSRWAARKTYAEFLKEDMTIREFLKTRLKDAGMEEIEIERFPGKILVIISTGRPGLIIGRGGTGIEQLKRELALIVARGTGKKGKQELRLEIREIKNPWTSAALTAQYIGQQLVKRMPHRRVLRQALGKIRANKEILGARVEVAGRLGGADMSRREWVQEGRLPRQTIRAQIDYSLHVAKTTYGTIGVKVWMYKGEKFE